MAASCPICSAGSFPTPWLSPLPFRTCSVCGFTFRLDRDDDAVHQSYTSGAYTEVRSDAYIDDTTIERRRKDARARLDYLARHVTSGRLLDVGTAGGLFVAEALDRGFEAEGIEPTPEFARFARERLGLPVRMTTVEEAGLEDASLDVVTMWHVLEHVPRPVDVLTHLAGALRLEGVLSVEVPNAGSHMARLLKRRWPALEPAVHVNQFNPSSLRLAFERAGFELVDMETVTYRPYMTSLERRSVGSVARRALDVARLRSVDDPHPWGHELLRATARVSSQD